MPGGGGTTVSVLGGIASLGEYYIHVTLGSGESAVRVRTQIDTGSSSLLVPGSACETCNSRTSRPQKAYAFVGNSSSAKKLKCDDGCGTLLPSSYGCADLACRNIVGVGGNGDAFDVGCFGGSCCSNDERACAFSISYGGDTSYSVSAIGELTSDRVAVKVENQMENHQGVVASTATINVIEREDGPWPAQVEGILGMAFDALNCNPTCFESAFSKLLRAGAAQSSGEDGSSKAANAAMFAICMGDEGGKLVLGDDGSHLIRSSNMVHTIPISPFYANYRPTYYTVGISQVHLGGRGSAPHRHHLISSFAHEAILDSGTTFMLLHADVWGAFVSRLRTHYCHLPSVCVPYSQSIFSSRVCLTSSRDVASFPSLTVAFVKKLNGEEQGDDELVYASLPPSVYFVAYNIGDGVEYYCLGIQKGSGSRSVLGDTFMRGFLTSFDRESMTVGLAVPDRNKCGSVALAGEGDDLDLEVRLSSSLPAASSSSYGQSSSSSPMLRRANALGATAAVALAALLTLVVATAAVTWVRRAWRRSSAANGMHFAYSATPFPKGGNELPSPAGENGGEEEEEDDDDFSALYGTFAVEGDSSPSAAAL